MRISSVQNNNNSVNFGMGLRVDNSIGKPLAEDLICKLQRNRFIKKLENSGGPVVRVEYKDGFIQVAEGEPGANVGKTCMISGGNLTVKKLVSVISDVIKTSK